MSARVQTILAEAQALSDARGFDPKDLTGAITIATTDEVRRVLLPRLMKVLDAKAPHVRLTFKSLQANYDLQELESGRTVVAISVN